MNLTMLVLNVSPKLEDELVDYLLGLESVTGFTSYAVRGHGAGQSLSIAEQVAGRRKRVQVEIMLDAGAVDAVVSGLAAQVGRDIAWWSYALSGSGHL